MEIFDGPYYKTAKWCIEFIGMWPYQSQRRRLITSFTFLFISFTAMFPMALFLFRSKTIDLDILIENSLSLGILSLSLIEHALIQHLQQPQLKLLLDQIARNWRRLKLECEVEIMAKNSHEGRFLVLLYVCYIYFAWVLYNILPFLPTIMNVILPLSNNTDDILLPFHADYIFFDQNDYQYETCLHASIVFFFLTSVFAGMGPLFIIAIQHTCGLFAITWLETMGEKYVNRKNLNTKLDSILIQNELLRAIAMHKTSISFVQLLESSFNLCFLVLQALIVIGFAIICFHMLHIYKQPCNMIRFTFMSIGTVLHLFYMHFVGQKIIDSSNVVFNAVYFSDWYRSTKEARQFTMIIMTRLINPCQLTAGKITILSMQTFGKLMKTSVSYLTVLFQVFSE